MKRSILIKKSSNNSSSASKKTTKSEVLIFLKPQFLACETPLLISKLINSKSLSNLNLLHIFKEESVDPSFTNIILKSKLVSLFFFFKILFKDFSIVFSELKKGTIMLIIFFHS